MTEADIEDKILVFITAAEDECLNRGFVPNIVFLDGPCPGGSGLAHIHPDSDRICVDKAHLARTSSHAIKKAARSMVGKLSAARGRHKKEGEEEEIPDDMEETPEPQAPPASKSNKEVESFGLEKVEEDAQRRAAEGERPVATESRKPASDAFIERRVIEGEDSTEKDVTGPNAEDGTGYETIEKEVAGSGGNESVSRDVPTSGGDEHSNGGDTGPGSDWTGVAESESILDKLSGFKSDSPKKTEEAKGDKGFFYIKNEQEVINQKPLEGGRECKGCGAPVNKGIRYCDDCKGKLTKGVKLPNKPETETKVKKRGPLPIIIAIVIIILIGAGVFFWQKMNAEEDAAKKTVTKGRVSRSSAQAREIGRICQGLGYKLGGCVDDPEVCPHHGGVHVKDKTHLCAVEGQKTTHLCCFK